jgi:molecular chaperone DnaK
MTIDYGIDLGTTNSTIAVLNGTAPDVVTDVEGSCVTPSAIWFDRRGNLHVGREARAHVFEDSDNAALEFKLRMGEEWQKDFQRAGRKMLPEEMSAEVLKELKAQVRMKRGEDISAAVITVPAAFELPQCEATRRAGELAGLSLSPLLQEPVAAALAYGFQSAANKVFWLVYDFGGGTFDAAVIQVRDGVIQVVNHAGDNYLGGKNIDWDIVEKLFIPRLTAEHPLTDFNRGNPKWRGAIAKLKILAEKAKIDVSIKRQPAQIWFDSPICTDDKGNEVEFEYQLTPIDVQHLIEPWVTQSINICRRALQEKGLSGRDVEKVILVGGSSLFPWLQERLAADLGAKLDFSIDPITVVARGAAVFAGTQRLEPDQGSVAAGTYKIRLEYDAVGSEIDPTVCGRVTPPAGASIAGLSVEITESRSQWRSGTICLAANGTFMTEVHAEKGRKCEFQIVLMDSRGTRLPCSPDRIAYTVGMVITSPPLTHNLGVAEDMNKPHWLFKKGSPLPDRGTYTFLTTVALRKGMPVGEDNIIRIPVIEGTNGQKADRNHKIGVLEILPTDPRVKRDVPLGSEVEVTIEIDQSRATKTTAYIPVLDDTFEEVFNPRYKTVQAAKLQQELKDELDRLEVLRGRATQVAGQAGEASLAHLESEQTVEQVKRTVAAAQGNQEALGEADKKLLDLRASIDMVETALEWPSLMKEASEQLEQARGTVEAHGNENERKRMDTLEVEIDQAVKERQPEVLRAKLEGLRGLWLGILNHRPEYWIGWRDYLQERRGHMRDHAAADRLFAQAQRAIEAQDLEALKAAVHQLIRLLPQDEREAAQARGSFGGTITS